jgi:2-polyprenyl-6-methoxyphenol hydroxylase-like FAD-dependent oxidoreductase
MSPVSKKSSFRVVIVGGGIAGLTLANTLQNADIDFVLLESRSMIDPQVGASIGVLPNGSRILDQVGCYDDIIGLTEPILRTISHKEDGSLIGEPTDTPILGAKRSVLIVQERNPILTIKADTKFSSAYSAAFLDRKLVLGILAKHIIDKSKILLNKRVVKVEHSPEKASVVCEDGSTVEGDIIVGADGTYSTVRREMWRHSDIAGEEAKFERDKKSEFPSREAKAERLMTNISLVMMAEYKCLFGISNQ